MLFKRKGKNEKGIIHLLKVQKGKRRMKRRYIRLEVTDSTNDYAKQMPIDITATEEMTIITAQYQESGRGQGTNHWESEAGKNLLFSVSLFPKAVAARQQYILSMAGALAVKAALDEYTSHITLKWPNDVYWRDRKISGTLIETSLSGQTIRRCIYGVGININQETFVSDAPNPVSLRQIVGHDTPPDEVLEKVLHHFEHYYQLVSEGHDDQIITQYKQALYRKEGLWPYHDAHELFMARIKDVMPTGQLILTDADGHNRTYAFKEVSFVINTEASKEKEILK